MENRNYVTEFVLLGFTEDPDMQKIIFVCVCFFVIYITTVIVNMFIMVTIIASPLFGENFVAGVEVILLTVMACDCYVAICKLLHYTTIMNWQVCGLLVGVAWVGGLLHATIQILFKFRLHFCGPNIIDHFMCDLNPLLTLTCTDTHILGLFIAANSGFICLLNYLLLLVSYVVILYSLQNHSLEGKHKVLSTCVSHITVAVLFFVPSIFVYLRPAAMLSIDKAVAVFCTVITPLLNPLIYTLSFDQMKNAVKKLCSRKAISEYK